MSKASNNNEVHEEETGEEEEEIDETSYKATKDAVLFAIEVSDSMLTPPPPSESRKADQEPPATAALKCAYHLMQQRIISNPKDMFGVLLYGTETSKFYDEDEETRGGLSYPHCYLFTDLDVPAADDVKELRALAEDEEKAEQILVPSKERVSMANVFFCANQIFTSKASNFSSRRLFIVTDNDNPHSNDKAMRLSATVRAKDLYDLGVIIELFPISTPDHEFDRKKFYDDIIYKASPTDPEAPAYGRKSTKSSTSGGDGISLLNSLLSSINSKSVPRRALFSNVPLEIGPDFKISVTGYLLIKRQEPARSCYIWIRGEKPKIVKAKTTLVANDTARTVDKSETTKAYRFGGAPVHFNQDELKSLRNFGDPVIRIIGFKPRSALPFWASIKHPTFIYPSEEDFVGSTRVFSALYQKLLNDEKLALVWFIPRRNAAPVMGAMIPGEEKLDDDGDQMAPQGMWILPLPFADDVRQNPETSRIPAPESMIDHMREVVQQLQLPKAQYDPQKYPNPSLQWHYRILQALALDEDLPEKPEDKTIPKYRQIDKRAGKHVSAWKEELESQRREMEGQNARTSTLVKRPAKSEDGQASKKMKVEGGGSVTNDVKANYEKGALNKLTVAILKEFLSTNNLSTSGKKADLVDRIEEFLDTK